MQWVLQRGALCKVENPFTTRIFQQDFYENKILIVHWKEGQCWTVQSSEVPWKLWNKSTTNFANFSNILKRFIFTLKLVILFKKFIVLKCRKIHCCWEIIVGFYIHRIWRTKVKGAPQCYAAFGGCVIT